MGVDPADNAWTGERGSRTSQISNPMNRDRIDIEVDLAETNIQNSIRSRGRCRLKRGRAGLARDGLARAFEGAETSSRFDLSKRAVTHGH